MNVLDIPVEPVPVDTDAWGRVYVRRAMASELSDILGVIDEAKGIDRFLRLVQLGACDSVGCRLFGEADRERLKTAPLEAITEIALAFLDANGLGEGRDEKKSSEPSSGSPSTLRTVSAARTRP